MKLLVDVGNTRAKAVLLEDGQFTPIAYSLHLFERFAIKQLNYACVRHDDSVKNLLEKAQHHGVEIVEATTNSHAFGVQCAYEHYQTLGIDRWLAVIGASQTFPEQNVVVVDAGTAITVDFVTAQKQHLGGWIVPGLELMTSSIAQRADKVFDDPNTIYQCDIGKSTPQALKSGCLAAQIGLVRQAMTQFDVNATLVLCGGTAPLMLEPLASFNPIHDELIVFKGLAQF